MRPQRPQLTSTPSNSFCSLRQSSTTLSSSEPVLEIKQEQVDSDCDSYPSNHRSREAKFIEIKDNSLNQKGYKEIRKICDTLQGEMILCEKMDESKKCAVKKINRGLYSNNICVDDHGMSIIVDEDIVKEGFFYKLLTVDNIAVTDSIPRFIDFFVSESYIYLITEYIEGEMTLGDFVEMAMIYIREQRLDLKEWRKICRYISWQCVAILYWLHNDLSIAHLDLTMV